MSAFSDLEREFYNPKIETLPYRELEEIQIRKLREVVKYGFDNCPFYYRKWKKAGVRPEDIRNLSDFQKRIPTFTKDDLRNEITEDDITGGITSCNNSDLQNFAMTSGTSGINTFVGVSRPFMDDFIEQLAMREYWMAKMRPGMKAFIVPAGWHFFGMAQNMVLTRMGVGCVSSWGSLFHRFIPNLMKAILDLEPDYFLGLPWTVPALISQSNDMGVEPRKLFEHVRYMSLAGESVTEGFRRKILDETDVNDVFESAGSVDGLWGGTDCSFHEGHHTWMDYDFLEVVDPESGDLIEDEDRGQVISTNLRLGGPLFIRFLGEDLVHKVKEKCECGRTHVRVEIHDRLQNSFRIQSRTFVPDDISRVIEEVCGVRLFTVIKPKANSEKLKVMIAKQNSAENPNRISEQLDELAKEKLGIGMNIEWVDSKRLPFVNRKFLRVIDELQERAS